MLHPRKSKFGLRGCPPPRPSPSERRRAQQVGRWLRPWMSMSTSRLSNRSPPFLFRLESFRLTICDRPRGSITRRPGASQRVTARHGSSQRASPRSSLPAGPRHGPLARWPVVGPLGLAGPARTARLGPPWARRQLLDPARPVLTWATMPFGYATRRRVQRRVRRVPQHHWLAAPRSRHQPIRSSDSGGADQSGAAPWRRGAALPLPAPRAL